MDAPEEPEDTWLQYLPHLHRALAAPHLAHGLPRSFVSLDFEETCAWWETLRYLFRVLLGWRNLPAGLAWWYEQDLPDFDDSRLRLVLDRWNTRGELDLFAAREWDTGGFTGTEGDVPTDFDTTYEPRLGWWRELRDRPAFAEPSPFGGGYNPLHLGHSDPVGLEDSVAPPTGQHNTTSRRAILIVSRFPSWRRELSEFGQTLPSLGDRSWHVEVFERSVGYLGRYRQSRETGLWFQGKHSLHMAGNPQASDLAEGMKTGSQI